VTAPAAARAWDWASRSSRPGPRCSPPRFRAVCCCPWRHQAQGAAPSSPQPVRTCTRPCTTSHCPSSGSTLLRAALRTHRFALWLDVDVLLQRDDDDILQHLHPEDFQALALEQVPSEHPINPNTGVWLLRSCPQALVFLDAVERAGQQPGPWADQGAVVHALGWDRGDERYRWVDRARATAFSRRTSWLPAGWNTRQQRTCVHHRLRPDVRLCRECDVVLWRAHESCPRCGARRPRLPVRKHGPGRDGQARRVALTVAGAACAVPASLAADEVLRQVLGS
jgi:hypothetical protein